MKRNRIIVLLPSYKSVPTMGMLTLVSWAFNVQAHYECELAVVSNLYIEDSRYTLARMAVEAHHRKSADAIVWLDDDHVWREQDFIKHVNTAIKSKYDALSAMYYSRSRPDRVVAQMCDSEANLEFKENAGIKDCEVLGFGMLVMKSSFLTRMFNHYSTELFRTEFVPQPNKNGKFLHYTEDKMFFRRAKELGKFKIGVNTDVVIGHCGVVR